VTPRPFPRAPPGFRTLFTAFHHFTPEQARGILADAMEQGQGIGIFEYTDRNFLVWAPPSSGPLPALDHHAAPAAVSFRGLLWTYLLPVIPLVAVWDGLVSCLRTYSPDELKVLTASWTSPITGGKSGGSAPSRVPHHLLLGWPERAA